MKEDFRRSIILENITYPEFKEIEVHDYLTRYKGDYMGGGFAKFSESINFSSGEELLDWTNSQNIEKVILDLSFQNPGNERELSLLELKKSSTNKEDFIKQVVSYGVKILFKNKQRKGDLIFFENVYNSSIQLTFLRIPIGHYNKYKWIGKMSEKYFLKAVYSNPR